MRLPDDPGTRPGEQQVPDPPRSRGPVRTLALPALTAVVTVLALVVGSAPASAEPWPGHPGRRLVTHTVHRGDTATGLATRYHAWTRELLAINHLHRSSVLYVGERIRIPVVVAAARRAHHHKTRHHKTRHHKTRHHKTRHHKTRHHKTRHHKTRQVRRHHAHHKTRHAGHHRAHHRAHHRTHHKKPHQTRHAHGWRHSRMTRAQVRRAITASARRHHVPVNLALAIAWQESGWQQHLVSPAGAIGVMQLLPSTARWMSLYTDRTLNPRNTYHNITGGVLLLRVLRAELGGGKRGIGAYYQGIGAVQRHGLYPSTRHYVRSVQAIRHHLRRTGSPT